MLRQRLNFYRCECGQNYRKRARCSCPKKCPKCGKRNKPWETVWNG